LIERENGGRKTILVTHFLRKPKTGLYSIERLYATVRDNLPEDISTNLQYASLNTSNWILPLFIDAWRASRYQGDINHVTGAAHFLTYFLKRKKTILTIHDFRNLESLTGIKKVLFNLLWYQIPIFKSEAIVVISEATKKKLIETFDVPADKVIVIPNTVPKPIRISVETTESSRPTMLMVGTRAPKNLIRQFTALLNLDVNILVIGNLTTEQQNFIEEHSLTVKTVSNLSDHELQECYEIADVLMFASIDEGFGMPIIEAQLTSLPVITSNLSSMPSVAGKGALLVDPYDVSAIRAAVSAILDDQQLAASLIAAGHENAKKYSPEIVAAQYADLYRLIADNN